MEMLTKEEKAALKCIITSIKRRACTPTVTELGRELKRSHTHAERLVKALVHKGELARNERGHRDFKLNTDRYDVKVLQKLSGKWKPVEIWMEQE
jgi:SOS-response transcriptional repressor LexA